MSSPRKTAAAVSETKPQPPQPKRATVALKESQVIGQYLRALESTDQIVANRIKDPETLTRWLENARRQLDEQTGVKKLLTFNRIRQLELQLAGMGADPKTQVLEEGFIKYAKGFADRHDVSYAAFRDYGVRADVLKRAGIVKRTS